MSDQNLQLLTKLENFTGATMQHLAEKGLLNSEATLSLAKYVMEARGDKSAEQVVSAAETSGQHRSDRVCPARELAELAASGSSQKTEHDAVIVVDKADPAGKVRLNYLVTAATWRPQYRFRVRERSCSTRISGRYRAANGRRLDRGGRDVLDRPTPA